MNAVTQTLAAQRDRWVLWLPVGAIAGAGLFLAAPVDPPLWLGPALFVAGIALCCVFAFWPSVKADGVGVALRRILAGLCALAAMFGLGAAAADLRTRLANQTPFTAADAPLRIEGWVTAIDPGERGPRLRLLVRSIEGVDAPPRYVRLAVSGVGVLTPGRAAICRGVLSPPAGPLAPGGYDFARRAFFEQLGASGFAFGRCRPAGFDGPPGVMDRVALRVAAMRQDLSLAIQEMAPGRGGAVAAALVTGDRSPIEQEVNDSLRDSGLGHLLSVSGVHMAVVGGLVFGALVWVLSLIGPIALRWPVKKIAAVGALLALGAYLIVSGFSVPALRSYVMAGVAFGAILLDRPAISMRGLALAAFIIVLILPESVLEPGFQMSFAATLALVAWFELAHKKPQESALPTPGPLIGGLQWIMGQIAMVIGVSLVAGLATDPFAIYHFQRFSLYALAANLAVAPIMSFVVAPAAGIAAVLAPFGYAEIPLQIMASALDLVVAIGEAFGTRPEAVRALPRPPDMAMLACVTALLWACLWRGKLRWGGLAFFGASLALYAAAPRPVMAFDGELRAVFARADAGAPPWTLIAKAGRSTYARDKLGAMLGIAPPALDRLAPPETCTPAFCAWRTSGGRALALVQEDAGFAPACASSALILTPLAAPQTCGGEIIDAHDLAARGGGFVYDAPDGLRVTRATPPDINRPWTPRAPVSDQSQE